MARMILVTKLKGRSVHDLLQVQAVQCVRVAKPAERYRAALDLHGSLEGRLSGEIVNRLTTPD
jgi:hypothetical protein